MIRDSKGNTENNRHQSYKQKEKSNDGFQSIVTENTCPDIPFIPTIYGIDNTAVVIRMCCQFYLQHLPRILFRSRTEHITAGRIFAVQPRLVCMIFAPQLSIHIKPYVLQGRSDRK